MTELNHSNYSIVSSYHLYSNSNPTMRQFDHHGGQVQDEPHELSSLLLKHI